MKELNVTYKEIQLMRELLIEELSSQFRNVNLEVLKLVEMRIQTILMAGIKRDGIESERKEFGIEATEFTTKKQ